MHTHTMNARAQTQSAAAAEVEFELLFRREIGQPDGSMPSSCVIAFMYAMHASQYGHPDGGCQVSKSVLPLCSGR